MRKMIYHGASIAAADQKVKMQMPKGQDADEGVALVLTPAYGARKFEGLRQYEHG